MANPVSPTNPTTPSSNSGSDSTSNTGESITGSTLQTLANAATFIIPHDTIPNPYTGAVSPTYNVNIPLNKDGTVNEDALVRKIYDLLYQANKGNPMNFNIYSDMAAYFINIGTNWNNLPVSLQQKIANFLGDPIETPNGNVSMPALLADSLVYGIYVTQAAAGVSNSQIMTQVQSLITSFAPASNANPWFRGFAQQLQQNFDDLPAYMAANPVTVANGLSAKTQFFFSQSLQNANLVYSSHATQWFNDYHAAEIKDLENQTDDPFILFMLLLHLLFDQNDDFQVQIGGFGSLLENLSALAGSNTSTITQFQGAQNSPFTAETAKQFINSLTDFANRFKDPRLSGVAVQIQQPLTNFFGTADKGQPGSSISLVSPIVKGGTTTVTEVFGETITTHEGGTTIDTLGQLIQAAQTGSPSGFTFDDVATALNAVMPNITPAGGTLPEGTLTDTVPQQYTTLVQSLQQMGTTVTSISNTTTTQSQFISSTSQQHAALINAALNSVVQVQSQAMRSIGMP